jgi:hypothetical protein
VKAVQGINQWFGDWTRVFMWIISGVKAVSIKPLQPKLDVINTPFTICLMCGIFSGVHFNNNYGISNKYSSSR